MIRGRFDFALSLCAILVGFLAPFWPFVCAGAVGAILSEHFFVALFSAFLFDLAFGSWPFVFSFPFPLTSAVILGILLFHLSRRYVRSH